MRRPAECGRTEERRGAAERVWCRSEKMMLPWSGWHETGAVYGPAIVCEVSQIPGITQPFRSFFCVLK